MADRGSSDWWARQEDKWSRSTFKSGYTDFPHSLFEFAGKLEIKATQQAVLFHLLDFCFDDLETREVTKAEIANRIKMDKRQVRRHLCKLEELGLITSSYPKKRGRHAKVYRFDGLAKKLSRLATASRSQGRQKSYKKDKVVREVAKAQSQERIKKNQ